MWSNIGFDEEICIIETQIHTLSGALHDLLFYYHILVDIAVRLILAYVKMNMAFFLTYLTGQVHLTCNTASITYTVDPDHRTHTVEFRYLEVDGTIFYEFKLPEVQINSEFGT